MKRMTMTTDGDDNDESKAVVGDGVGSQSKAPVPQQATNMHLKDYK